MQTHYNIISRNRFATVMDLIDHMVRQHAADMDVNSIGFKNYASFLSWKEEQEFYSNSQFTQKCSPVLCGRNKIWYFYCNRAGTFTPRGQQLRQEKSQGTRKIGKQCTAHIKAKVNEDNGHVEVMYCATHNHVVRLAHVQIPNQTRMIIASKLKQGISMERILDDIRESVSNGLCRQHLVTRQDLHNIKAQYNIDGIVRHKNDLTSVRVWVQEMSTLEYNPVLIFKPQGESKDNFTENDFLLVLQTEFQRDMFQRFGSVAVCVMRHMRQMHITFT